MTPMPEPSDLPTVIGVRHEFVGGRIYRDVLDVRRYRLVYLLSGTEGTFTVSKTEADRLGLPMRRKDPDA